MIRVKAFKKFFDYHIIFFYYLIGRLLITSAILVASGSSVIISLRDVLWLGFYGALVIYPLITFCFLVSSILRFNGIRYSIVIFTVSIAFYFFANLYLIAMNQHDYAVLTIYFGVKIEFFILLFFSVLYFAISSTVRLYMIFRNLYKF